MNIYQKVSNFLETHDTVNIVIAGQTCSGKTTLAKQIHKHFSENHSVCIISQDDYFKNLCDIPVGAGWYLMEVPEAFEVEEFRSDVRSLLQYGYAKMPIYDISANMRVSKNKMIHSCKINIFEGLHTIQILSDLENSISIFVDTPPVTCLERRIARDSENLGVPENRIREYWNDCIQPMSERFVLPQKYYADIIF